VSGSQQRQRGGRSDLDPRSTAVCFPVRVTVSMLFIEKILDTPLSVRRRFSLMKILTRELGCRGTEPHLQVNVIRAGQHMTVYSSHRRRLHWLLHRETEKKVKVAHTRLPSVGFRS